MALFNSLFSDCQEVYPDVELKGLRMGYPTNFWADLGDEVSILLCLEPPIRCQTQVLTCGVRLLEVCRKHALQHRQSSAMAMAYASLLASSSCIALLDASFSDAGLLSLLPAMSH